MADDTADKPLAHTTMGGYWSELEKRFKAQDLADDLVELLKSCYFAGGECMIVCQQKIMNDHTSPEDAMLKLGRLADECVENLGSIAITQH